MSSILRRGVRGVKQRGQMRSIADAVVSHRDTRRRHETWRQFPTRDGSLLLRIHTRQHTMRWTGRRHTSRADFIEDDMAAGDKILLIEDDRDIATTLRSVLEAAGYEVGYASNGKDGQRMIQELRPRLVITDMMMPQLGGFPVLEFLKQLDDPPRVIMITANEGGRHKAYAEMLGVADYLRKPFAMDVLLESVERALAVADEPAPATRKKGPRKKAD
ncbi:MAG: response regulator transcription factor [Planctomycetales bacterium]